MPKTRAANSDPMPHIRGTFLRSIRSNTAIGRKCIRVRDALIAEMGGSLTASQQLQLNIAIDLLIRWETFTRDLPPAAEMDASQRSEHMRLTAAWQKAMDAVKRPGGAA